MKRIAVYCGSNAGTDPAFLESTLALADAMANADLDLVYGGSNNGLMGQLADRLLVRQRHVTGVMPEGLISWEMAHSSIPELITVSSMHERKQVMADHADGFIALPGGIGTLEEIVEMISWAQLGVHHKPCAFLNINGYYDHLIAFFDHSVEQGLMRERIRSMILIEDQPELLLQKMSRYQSPVTHQWADQSSC
ncbi:MAG: TIGR00730 family Rossman fold protein [Motiliproteus sp.]|nr:TIGR00730 family Rossman fold protein [Motiliproteus sp.]MCW9051090.1 TIGR00730 family Rossman fold protein [Motiliproteus sp.]